MRVGGGAGHDLAEYAGGEDANPLGFLLAVVVHAHALAGEFLLQKLVCWELDRDVG